MNRSIFIALGVGLSICLPNTAAHAQNQPPPAGVFVPPPGIFVPRVVTPNGQQSVVRPQTPTPRFQWEQFIPTPDQIRQWTEGSEPDGQFYQDPSTGVPARRPVPSAAQVALLTDKQLADMLSHAAAALDARLSQMTGGVSWQSHLKVAEIREAAAASDDDADKTRELLKEIAKRYDKVAADEKYEKINRLWGFQVVQAGLSELDKPSTQRRRGHLAATGNQLRSHLGTLQGGEKWDEYLQLQDLIKAIKPTRDQQESERIRQHVKKVLERWDKTAQDERYHLIVESLAFKTAHQAAKDYNTALASRHGDPNAALKLKDVPPSRDPNAVLTLKDPPPSRDPNAVLKLKEKPDPSGPLGKLTLKPAETKVLPLEDAEPVETYVLPPGPSVLPAETTVLPPGPSVLPLGPTVLPPENDDEDEIVLLPLPVEDSEPEEVTLLPLPVEEPDPGDVPKLLPLDDGTDRKEKDTKKKDKNDDAPEGDSPRKQVGLNPQPEPPSGPRLLLAISLARSLPDGLSEAQQSVVAEIVERLQGQQNAEAVTAWTGLIRSLVASDGSTKDVSPVGAFIIRQSYLSKKSEMRGAVDKVRYHGEVNRQLRRHIAELRSLAGRLTGDARATVETLDALPTYRGGATPFFVWRKKTLSGDGLKNHVTLLKARLESAAKDREIADLQLQQVTQKQQQLMQQISNITKAMHEAALAVVRNTP